MTYRGALCPPFVLALVIASAGPSCKSDKPSSESGGEPTATTSTTTDAEKLASRLRLVPMAEETLAELVKQETRADVTCWTSFRQLDWYIAEKPYSEFATLAKVTAIKGLTRALWLAASRKATAGDGLSAADIKAALAPLAPVAVPEEKRSELTGFANDIGLRNYTDYQKTAEHWRIVLAVIADEIFYGSPADKLVPARGEALVALADGATTLSLHLLKRSGALAEADKKNEIDAEHVKAAFAALSGQLGLASTEREAQPLSHADSMRVLAPITKKLIDGKTSALLTFNKATGDLAADLSRVTELPIDAGAAAALYGAALSFARFATSGADPMRADTYISDVSLEQLPETNAPYLDHLHLHNVIEQVFPHRTLANGDVVVRFEPNPGPLTVGKVNLDPFEIRMLDHRMNGVRDSAVQWKVLADVFAKRPYAFDPFAAEYLSEVVSMMITLNIERALRIAKANGATKIDGALIEQVLAIRSMVQVPMGSDARPAWDKEWSAKKRAALGKAGGKLFVDATAGSGLPTTLRSAPAGGATFDIHQMMGSGVAVGDVDGDGYPDAYLAGEGLGVLMRNRGKAAPGTFEDATATYKLPAIGDGRGALFFDLEGDGDLDLVIARDSGSQVFRQEGGAFVDASAALGFKTGRGAHALHVFDFDGDGDLDIYVGYYGSKNAHADPSVTSKPSLDGRNGTANQLWRNDGGKLVEVGKKAGVADIGWTLAIGSFDYESDGDPDLYLANDFGANSFFRNDGGGAFTDVTQATGTGDRGSGMNVDFTDVNGDGFWDLYVTNIDMFSKRIKVIFPRDESTINIDQQLAESFQYLSGNKFYVSKGKTGFESGEERLIEPGDHGWGWDALFFDYDNDGDDDLYLTNGWLEGSYAGDQKNQMFLREDVFHLAPPSSPEAVAGNTRSVAAADFDRDGDIDLLLNQFRRPPVLLKNNQRSKGGWVRLALKGKGKNPRAVGAEVIVRAGTQTIRRQVSAGRGYISQAETAVHAGVGSAAKVDVEVRWPGGATSKHPGLAANQQHEISAP